MSLAQVRAQDVEVTANSHQSTLSPANSRFEIVQSTLAAKWTFRLDRFSGRVWQLVKTKDDDVSWQETKVLERPQIQNAGRLRFQLFLSGLAARHTFLLDTDTGKTWILAAGKSKDGTGTEVENIIWQPFLE